MTDPITISAPFISQIDERLNSNKRIRRNLPIWGRVHIDRQLPFLTVYRQPVSRQDAGTEYLIMGQPAYLMASAKKNGAPGLSQLVNSIAQSMSKLFGCFLIVEIWSGLEDDLQPETAPLFPGPAFTIIAPTGNGLADTIETLENELAAIKINQMPATVNLVNDGKPSPARLPALLSKPDAERLNCVTIGIITRPIYRQQPTDETLPLVHQAMIRDVSLALQRTFFTFVRTKTSYRPPHYQVLGRRATVKAVWQIDKQMAQMNGRFDFLLQVTPINTQKAWVNFKRHKFNQPPAFRYRPHPIDPALLKRQLWNIRLDRIEDPTIQHLFREKRQELDIQISMLGNMNKPDFLYGSMQLFGKLDDDLLDTARGLLEIIPAHSREKRGKKQVASKAFAELAYAEIENYRQQFPDFKSQVILKNSITGLMVSQGNLLVGNGLKMSASRVEALLAHEVGTHVLTYFNGQAQPFKLLSVGLAGYEELQEGIAVLSEYLVGGLSKPRLRLLAARVVAAQSLIDGASFIDTFRLLTDNYQFKQQFAFNLVTRVYRGGGYTKDAIYLRGLLELLQYLRSEPLHELFFIGKIGISHIPIIQELRRRKVLHAPALLPHYLNMPEARSRLQGLSQGFSALDLIERK